MAGHGDAQHVVACVRLGASQEPQPAVVCGSRVHLFDADAVSSVAQLVALCHEARSVAAVAARLSRRVVGLDSVTLCAPLPRHCNVFGIGKNYREHVKEVDSTLPGISSAATPEHPIVFCKAPGSVCGPGDAIVLPPHSQQVDYEGELGVVIGRSGRHIPATAWRDHVFGYTVLNDVSARDLQKRHQQWFIAKSCDTFCPAGPWVVPLAGWPGPVHGDGEPAVRLRTWVDGQLRQEGNTGDMMFRIPQLIETISAGLTLHVGDVIATGTPAGVGAGFKPPRWLAPGNTVRIDIDHVGTIENRVVGHSKH